MFDRILELIDRHPRYGPNMAEAVRERTPLVLDYHSHHPSEGFCCSIRARKPNPLQILGQPEDLQELAHIKGVGGTAADCVPLMTRFGEALQARYGLEARPRIYLNGRPVEG